MKILLIGFQRSGTTLLRRIVQAHPDVKKAFHECFLLKKYPTRKALMNHVSKFGIKSPKDNWGEKVPFYPSMRGISVKGYTQTWNEYFGKGSRIVHITRHPIDVALSIEKKYKGQKFGKAIRVYKKIMPSVVNILERTPHCFSFKYEDMLLNPDEQIEKIFNFCGLKMFDYKARLAKIPKPMYRKIDSSRAFAYKGKVDVSKLKLQSTIDAVNKIAGTKYDL